VRLAIDLGTSHTVAMIERAGQPARPVLFDGSPLLPSGVFAGRDGVLHTGRDAERLAYAEPERFEPYPKRRIDEGEVWLGEVAVPVVNLLATVLRRVVHEVGHGDPTVLTCPADWGTQRRAHLLEACRRAELGRVVLVDEPIAAAGYFVQVLGQPLPPGQSLAVFDFGAGTLDLAVVRNDPDGLRVLASGGLDDLGGLDVDEALAGHLLQLVALRDRAAADRLAAPADLLQQRERREFRAQVRTAKEMLSRAAVAPVTLPRAAEPLHLTREELERVAGPLVDRAVDESRRLLQRAAIGPGQLAGLLLVGGSSRIPLVSTRLHTRFGVAPTVPEQPELPVAAGALLAAALERPPAPPGPEWNTGPTLDQPSFPPYPPPSPVPVAVETRSRRRSRPALLALVAALLVAAIPVAIWLAVRQHGSANAQRPGGGGSSLPAVPAVPAGFATCDVGVRGAVCPTSPTCWNGLVVTAGGPPQARSVGCAEPHYWQTFAAVVLPASTAELGYDELRARPEFTELCTAPVLQGRSSRADKGAGWEVDAIAKKVEGATVLHCLARPGEGGEWTGSAFR
jgi:hypothetical protein